MPIARGVAEFGLLSGLFCAVVFVWALVWFFIALWVHGNAPRHGKNPLVWFLAVFLLGFIGLILYFLARGAGGRGGGRGRRQRSRARARAAEKKGKS